MKKTKINVYKTKEYAELPVYATRNSACFDLKVYFNVYTPIKIFDARNMAFDGCESFSYKNSPTVRCRFGAVSIVDCVGIDIPTGCRALVPTGLIFDIPDDYSLRLHVRSSTGGKMGLMLSNSQGIVDPDYTDEMFLLLTNTNKYPVTIFSGDRLAQGEFVKLDNKFEFEETLGKLYQKTDRTGGFGSTGKN